MTDDIIRRISSASCPCCMDVLSEARDQIERLRLTAEDREAIANGASSLESEAMREGAGNAGRYMRRFAATLRALLERLA